MTAVLATAMFVVLAGAGMLGMHAMGGKFVQWSVEAYGPLEGQGKDRDAACAAHAEGQER